MIYAILGANNGGQALSGWLAMRGHEVRLYEIVGESSSLYSQLGKSLKDNNKRSPQW